MTFSQPFRPPPEHLGRMINVRRRSPKLLDTATMLTKRYLPMSLYTDLMIIGIRPQCTSIVPASPSRFLTTLVLHGQQPFLLNPTVSPLRRLFRGSLSQRPWESGAASLHLILIKVKYNKVDHPSLVPGLHEDMVTSILRVQTRIPRLLQLGTATRWMGSHSGLGGGGTAREDSGSALQVSLLVHALAFSWKRQLKLLQRGTTLGGGDGKYSASLTCLR